MKVISYNSSSAAEKSSQYPQLVENYVNVIFLDIHLSLIFEAWICQQLPSDAKVDARQETKAKFKHQPLLQVTLSKKRSLS